MKTIFFTSILILFVVFPKSGYTQLIAISGYITDVITNDTLKSVSVYESNSGIGTISNNHGFYRIRIHKGNGTLTFSEANYKPYTLNLSLNSDTVIYVKLVSTKLNDKSETEMHAVNKDKLKTNTSRRRFIFF